MSIVINKTVRPAQHAPFIGAGFVGLTGDKADMFLSRAQHFTVVAEGIFRSVNENLDQLRYMVSTVMIGGAICGAAVKVLGNATVGVYAFSKPEGQDACLKMLEECHGNNSDDYAKLSAFYSNAPASSLYSWENDHFVESAAIDMVLKTVKISVETAKEATSKHSFGKSELLDFAETMALLREMATAYKIYNLEVIRINFDGRVMGSANTDARQHNDKGHSKIMKLSEITFRHVVIHEFAHIVDFARDGASGHGNRFRETYETLLRQFGGEQEVNVTIPRI